MRCTAKNIVKIGLLAEILTMMLGQMGEIWLHYRSYSEAMDVTFGHYRLMPEQSEEFELDFNPAKLRTDPNVQHYVHKELQNPDVIISRILRPEPLILPPKQPVSLLTSTKESSHKRLQHLVEKEDDEDEESPEVDDFSPVEDNKLSALAAFEEWLGTRFTDTFNIRRPFDPRPLVMLSVVTLLNTVFTVGVLFEQLTVLSSMIVVWMLYLIACVLQLHGREVHSVPPTTVMSFFRDPLPTWISWSTSLFLILVLFIILILDFVFIALIVDERRFVPKNRRVRTRSRNIQFIPLVKSKDLDLDEI